MRSSYVDIKRTTAVALFAVAGLAVIPSLASAAEAGKKGVGTTSQVDVPVSTSTSSTPADPPVTVSSSASAPEAIAQDEVFSAAAAISLPGGKQFFAFDISYVDATLGRYVLGDRTNKAVDLIDTSSNSVIKLLTATPPFAGATGNNNTSGPDGVIIVRAGNNGDGTNEVWAGDGPSTTTACTLSTVPQSPPTNTNCSTVKVIDLGGTNATLHVIATGGLFRADEMCLDTADNLLMVANNADTPPFGSIISTKDYTVKHQISFTFSTNGAEQCQWSPRTGLFYITIPGINTPDDGTGEVLAINPKSGKIVKTFPIPLQVCSTPQGMAVGPDEQIMVGCNGSGSGNGLHSGIIINENSGAVIAVIPDESGPDEVYYNEGDGQYFLARSAAVGSNQLLGVVDANGAKADSSVITATKLVTGASVHSVAADSGTNKVFVPIPGCNPKSTTCPLTTAPPSTVCSSKGGVDANGCIAVFTASPDDKGKTIVRGNGNNNDQGEDD
jgi:hypothetical protein